MKATLPFCCLLGIWIVAKLGAATPEPAAAKPAGKLVAAKGKGAE